MELCRCFLPKVNKSISTPSKSRHEHSKPDWHTKSQQNMLLSTIFISFMIDIFQAPLSFQTKPSCVSCPKKPPFKNRRLTLFMCENAPGFHADLHKATVVSLPLCDLPTMSSSNVHLRRCKEDVEKHRWSDTVSDGKTEKPLYIRIHGTGIFNLYHTNQLNVRKYNIHGPCEIRRCQRRKHFSANVFGFFEMSTQN